MTVDAKDYRRCDRCDATFLTRDHWPSVEQELAHYDSHQNNVDDPAYRRFLSRVSRPLLAVLAERSRGLDYGCGPGPALAAMLEGRGHTMALYDPFYQPDQTALERTYDFITCTEVAEHFQQPAEEFDRLDRLLKPGGWLAVMTMLQTDDARFANWHYRRDPTHVVFYRETTLRRIAEDRGWSIRMMPRNVALMRTPAGR